MKIVVYETKQQSKHWGHSGFPAINKELSKKSVAKVIVSVFRGGMGIPINDYLTKCRNSKW